ncbi:dihydrofolate reductase [Agrococcus sp. UYP33]
MSRRDVVVCHLLSLDGVAEAPEEFFDAWGDEADAAAAEWCTTQDAVVLGRRSYDEWVRFWPGSDLEPFASFIGAVEKHVATSAPLDPPWSNARAIDGDLVEGIRQLRSRPGGEIGVHASISVARALLAAGVVDRLRLLVAPTIVGSGRRLLDSLPPMRLTPIRSEVTPGGCLLLDHRVALAR